MLYNKSSITTATNMCGKPPHLPCDYAREVGKKLISLITFDCGCKGS